MRTGGQESEKVSTTEEQSERTEDDKVYIYPKPKTQCNEMALTRNS